MEAAGALSGADGFPINSFINSLARSLTATCFRRSRAIWAFASASIDIDVAGLAAGGAAGVGGAGGAGAGGSPARRAGVVHPLRLRHRAASCRARGYGDLTGADCRVWTGFGGVLHTGGPWVVVPS